MQDKDDTTTAAPASVETRADLVKAALVRMDQRKMGSTFDDAYHAMQGAADRMDDNEFMFEAGKRAAMLLHRERLLSAAKAAVEKAFVAVYKESR